MYRPEHEDWLIAADKYLDRYEDERSLISAVLLIDKVIRECGDCEYERDN